MDSRRLKCTTSQNVVFREEEIYKDTIIQKQEESVYGLDGTDKQTKKSTQKDSFSPSLIRGPSGPNYELGETSSPGNTSMSQQDLEDQGSSSESESDDETKGLTFVEDTEATGSIDNYMLARDCVFGTLYVCLTNSFQGFIESFQFI